MKKRINNSEIERAKTSSRLIFLLTILMLFVVIGGLVFYVIYDKGLIKFKSTEDNNNIEEKSIFSSDKSEIHVDDNRIVGLFDIVKITVNECEGYNVKDKVEVKEMSDKCKFSLASNIYRNHLENDNNNFYITEDDVRDSYEMLFGYSTYKALEEIPYNNYYTLLFNDSDKVYFSNDKVEDVGSSFDAYEKIISVSRKGNYLYVESVPLFYNKPEKVLCKDFDCEEVIDKDVKENNADYYNLYLDHNKDKLNHYKYMFKLDNVGFYRYVGFEKTKN